MCGIAGIISLRTEPIPRLNHHLKVMNSLQSHRGPDGEGVWRHSNNHIGLSHQRLSIIDVHSGAQPMCDDFGNIVVHNGEIYNYLELRKELGEENFKTSSDTEVILLAYQKWGEDCVNHFRGMFAFALWDTRNDTLFLARDRFGIKPLYYTIHDEKFFFASEIKALMPFLPAVETDIEGLQDYLTFQLCLGDKTLFKGVKEIPSAHVVKIHNGQVRKRKYWEVYYTPDRYHSEDYFIEKLQFHLEDSVRLHTRSDVPIGAYISGGLDSSTIAGLASRHRDDAFMGFTGKFTYGEGYDESVYARDLCNMYDFELQELDITVEHFINNIERTIHHLDYPIAGPGSFPQFMISQLAAKHRKVVLGGQGGDEIFGGYTRYLIAYFEQCIKGAIEGTMDSGNFIVTYESIIPNLRSLKNYKPLIQKFWSKGVFDDLDARYFHLIDRAPDLGDEVRWDIMGEYDTYQTFREMFNADNVGQQSYFDLMTHFDFKTLLPALLQIEDRVSMAHGLESRVPLLDHPLVELAATIPSDIKFKDGKMKRAFIKTVQSYLPNSIVERKDKMGFPVPLNSWLKTDARDFVYDTLSTTNARQRVIIDNDAVLRRLDNEKKFSRTLWGLLSLEIWQQQFHDKAAEYKRLAEN